MSDIDAMYSLEGGYLQGFSHEDYEDYPMVYDEPPPKSKADEIIAVIQEVQEHLDRALLEIGRAMESQGALDDLMKSVDEVRMKALDMIYQQIETEKACYEPEEYDGPTLEDLS